jgi:AcrR family transcriptional regulator
VSAPQPSSRRQDLICGTVDYLLEHGLITMSLRPLARALGTSDRMLLYYFENKEQIVEEALLEAGRRLRASFAANLPESGFTPKRAIEAAIEQMTDPATRSLLQLWVEVIALAARGSEPVCEQVVAGVTASWSEWLEDRLAVPENLAAKSAATVMAVIEGMLLLRLAGRDDLVHSARRLLSESLVIPSERASARRTKHAGSRIA